MKRFTFMLLAAFIAVVAFAAAPSAKAVRMIAPKAQTGKLLQQAGKVDAPRSVPMGKFKAPMKAAEDYVIITEQPAGELKTYKRDGSCYYVQNQSVYYGAQSGSIDIVWGADNKVYFKDIVSGLEVGTWVEGTLSSDGGTITVPLGQNILYSETYDACVAIQLLNYVEGSGFVADTEAASVTFTVDDGVLSLQGTGFTSVSLGATWTDDGSIQDYGDYESVYTEYTQDLTIVTPPDNVLAMSFEAPLQATIFQGQAFESTVKMAFDLANSQAYIQGLVQLMPDAWVRGDMNLETGEIIIPTQFLGYDEEENKYFMAGYGEAGVGDYTMTVGGIDFPTTLQDLMQQYLAGTLDYSKITASSSDYLLVNNDGLSLNCYVIYQDVFIGNVPGAVVTADFTFDFNAMTDEPCSTSTDHSGDIPAEGRQFVEGVVTLTVSAATGNTANRFWNTDNGPQLRVYSGTMTFSVPEGMNITGINFNHNGKWGTNTVNVGGIDNNTTTNVATWTGAAQEVVLTIAANTQLNSIVVTVAAEGGEPQPIEPAEGTLFTFDDGTLEGWTTIDADGDGYCWIVNDKSAGGQIATHNDSNGSVFSQSYSNDDSAALTPDNFLVSPKMTLDGKISFYACAQDASYPAEYFAVAVSTKGNTDAADFKNVQEWTMTAAREGFEPTNARIFRGPNKVSGSWYLYTVDLSQYEGAEGYVAIRHFNCTDNFYLVVDDITLETSQIILPDYKITPAEGTVKSLSDFTMTFNNYDVAIVEGEAAQAELYKDENFDEPVATAALSLNENVLSFSFDDITEAGAYTLLIPEGTLQNVTEEKILGDLEFFYTIEAAPEVVVLPEGLTAETWYLNAAASESTIKNQEVAVAIDGSDIYIQGINAEYLPEAWVKGTIDAEAGTATFATGQYFGAFDYNGTEYDMFFVGTEDGSSVSDVVFAYDAEAATLTTDMYIVISAQQAAVSYYEYYSGATITREPAEVPELVELPEGVEPEEWALEGFWGDGASGNDVQRAVGVAFDGTDVYVQGLAYYFEESWLKGTIDAETGIVTFPSGQLVGEDDYGREYMVGFDGETFCDIHYAYDAEAKTLTQVTPFVMESQTETGLDEEGEFAFWGIWEVSYLYAGEPVEKEAVEAPEGLETETYLFSAMELVEEEEDADRARVLKAEGDVETVTFDFNAMTDEPCSNNGHEGDISEEGRQFVADNVTLTVSASTTSTANRFWNTNDGPQLRVYGGTMTFDVPEGYTMSQIVFNNGKWNDGNAADSGEFDGATWTGNAQNVVVTIAGNTQINSINVTVAGGGDEPTPVDPDEPTLQPYTTQIQVGFDGNDVYFSGINDNTADMWMKGTLSEDGTTVTIPANQYMGFISSWFSVYDFYMTAVNEEGEFTDLVLNFDAENNKFTTDQTVMLNGSRFVYYPYQTFTEVEITKMPEFAATPADPSIGNYKFEGTSYPYIDFVIPAQDVDGNDILASKLFYTVWTEVDGVEEPFVVRADEYRDVTEDMTEIPYNWDDGYDIYKGGSRFYINPASVLAYWTKIGIQSIYYGGGERNVSEIAWMENPVKDPTATGITTVKADDLKGAAIYNLAGQRLQTVQKGLNIINGRKVVIK